MFYDRYEREHIVLFIVVIALIIIVLKGVLTPGSDITGVIYTGVGETNLDGLRIMDKQSPKEVTYGDGTTEYFPNNFTGLFINGSIMENANIIMDNDRALGPLKLISAKLGADVSWDGNSNIAAVKEGNETIEFEIGEKYAKLNGITVSLDAAPIVVNGYAYVPIRFLAESLNCKVDWFDGKAAEQTGGAGVPKAHYVLGMRQVMVSSYPPGAKALGNAEAVQKVKDQLIIAYEQKYNTAFKPLESKPPVSTEQDNIRYEIANLHVESESDRFFIMTMMTDFMIDKYTGTVYVFNNGEIQTIDKFNPKASDAFAFGR